METMEPNKRLTIVMPGDCSLCAKARQMRGGEGCCIDQGFASMPFLPPPGISHGSSARRAGLVSLLKNWPLIFSILRNISPFPLKIRMPIR